MNKHISNLKSVTRTDSNFDISSYCKLTKTTRKITEVSETATGGVLQRKMFLKILQNLQEFTTLLRLWLSRLLVNFAKFLRTSIMELPWTNSMREKCSDSEFSDQYFRIQSESGKIRTRKLQIRTLFTQCS